MRPVLRFAPSPNGRLHLGHAYSALLNARIAERLGGTLLLRIEDIDPVRSRPELIAGIHDDLAWLGVRFDSPARRQSAFFSDYARAVEDLAGRGLAYPCFCSRGDIAARLAAGEGTGRTDPDGTPLYPGTCRDLSRAEAAARCEAGEPHTWRLDMARALAAAPGPHRFRCFAVPERNTNTLPPLRGRVPAEQAGEGLAPPFPEPSLPSPDPRSREGHPPPLISGLPEISKQMLKSGRPDFRWGEGMRPVVGEEHDVSADPARWGDAVIARRDVPTSYHLAVVLDDHAQGITHVVRGQDLEAPTDLHVLLQRLLGLATPAYHHHALIRADDGEKLAKSRGSASLADLRARGIGANEVRASLGF